NLGVEVRAQILVNAASMIAQMQNALGGSGIRGLPREITTHGKYENALLDAGRLVFLYGATDSHMISKALEISEEMPADYQVHMVAMLLMSAFAPAPTASPA